MITPINISLVRPEQRPTGAQQDQRATGRGEEDLPFHPHQAADHRGSISRQAPPESHRTLGMHYQARDREIRPRGETEEAGL